MGRTEMANIQQSRMHGMLESLQQTDPNIVKVEHYSKFVVGYLLQQEGANPGWRKANIEGPVYLVERNTDVLYEKYKIIVKNQFSNNDLLDSLHPDWELDCQKNYIFYKGEDATKQIRGLWFHEDSERQKMEEKLEEILKKLREAPQQQARVPAPPAEPAGRPAAAPTAAKPVGDGRETAGVVVTQASLSKALHAMADDDNILNMIMQKLKQSQQ